MVFPTDARIEGDLTNQPQLLFPINIRGGNGLGALRSFQTHQIVIDTAGKPFRALVDASTGRPLATTFNVVSAENPTPVLPRRWSPNLLLYKGAFVTDNPLQNLVSQNSGVTFVEVGVGQIPLGGPLNANLPDVPLVVEDGAYTLVVIPSANSENEAGEGGKYVLYLDGAAIAVIEPNPGDVVVVVPSQPNQPPQVVVIPLPNQLHALQSLSGFAGRQNLRVLTGNITSALIEGQVTRAANISTQISTQGTAAEPGMFPWFRLSNAKDVGGTNKLSVPAVQFGVDWSLAPNLVAGLSLSGATMEASNPTASLKATQIAVQPYVGWSAGNWRGAASVVLGRVDYESLVTIGGTASAKGDLRAVLLDAAYDFELSPAATLSPFAAVRLGRIDLSETGGSLAATGIGTDVTFEEVSIGATYARNIGPGTARLTLSADHFDTNAPINLSAGAFDQTGWSGGLGLGYEADIAAGLNINADAKVTGLGSDSRVGELSLTFRWSF